MTKLLPRIGLLLVLAVSLHASGALCPAQGKFRLADTDIQGMRFGHYFPLPERKYHDVDFEWTFQKDTFTLKKGKSPIPAELQSALLEADEHADHIEGTWQLKGGTLLLTNIKAGTAKARTEASLGVYKTAPTVVRIGVAEAQYVFGTGK